MSPTTNDPSDVPVSASEAGKLFPRPLSTRSVLRRIKDGIDGVKLTASFDGYRYWVRPSEVERFMSDLSETRRNIVEHLSETVRTREERAKEDLEYILRM